MAGTKIKDGFLGEKQINIPPQILNGHIRKMPFLNAIYITHIGYFPHAQYHFRERKHGCEDYILFYCLGGRGHFDTHLGKFSLNVNQFAMLPPNHYHSYQADIEDPWTIYWVHFSGSKLDELERQFQLSHYVKPTDIFYSDEILSTWQEMFTSLEKGYAKSNVSYANLTLYRFLSFFIFPDRKKLILREQELAKTDPLDQSIIFMKAHIADRMTVEDMADRCDMSTSHFTARFKTRTGMAPMDYFIRMKIHYACQLLSQSDFKIKEVGEKLGYDDPYYFSRIFKKVTGKSPVQYKEGK